MKVNTHLVCTDDGVQMFLETTRDLKVGKSYEGVDWESVKGEYEKIHEKCVSSLPLEDEMFPHPASVFCRRPNYFNNKANCVKYRKNLDTGRQSGRSRIVATFFDICNKIWSGFPATESIESGLERGDTRERQSNKLKKILLNLSTMLHQHLALS